MGGARGFLTTLGGGVAAWPVPDPHAHLRLPGRPPPPPSPCGPPLALPAARTHSSQYAGGYGGADYEPG